MPVSFDNPIEGQKYECPHLAQLLGYRGFQAISRGVVTPANTKFIILFVTGKKQESLTQYNDYFERPYLHWQGEAKHFTDNRVINAQASGDEIHLFHRPVHHSLFTYKTRTKHSMSSSVGFWTFVSVLRAYTTTH